VYYAGEFDWSGRSKSWGLLGWVLVPIFLGLLALLIGGCGKIFPIVFQWTTFKPQKPGQTKPQRQRSLIIRQSHVAICMILIVAPITAGVIYATSIKGTGIEAFLAEAELPDSSGSGDLFWSLFGHDDRCCDWVDHVEYMFYFINSRHIHRFQIQKTFLSSNRPPKKIDQKKLFLWHSFETYDIIYFPQ
jgi:hypothetical protein